MQVYGRFSEVVLLCAITIMAVRCSSCFGADDSVKPYPVPEWLANNYMPVFSHAPELRLNPDHANDFKTEIDAGVNAYLCAPGLPWWYDGRGFYDIKDGKKVYASASKVREDIKIYHEAGARTIGGIAPYGRSRCLQTTSIGSG